MTLKNSCVSSGALIGASPRVGPPYEILDHPPLCQDSSMPQAEVDGEVVVKQQKETEANEIPQTRLKIGEDRAVNAVAAKVQHGVGGISRIIPAIVYPSHCIAIHHLLRILIIRVVVIV